jgi:hypothetical protein
MIVSWAAMNLTSSGWMSWMADLIPEATRGSFFLRRSAVFQGVTVVWFFLAERPPGPLPGRVALLGLRPHLRPGRRRRRRRHTPPPPHSRASPRGAAPLHRRRFRRAPARPQLPPLLHRDRRRGAGPQPRRALPGALRHLAGRGGSGQRLARHHDGHLPAHLGGHRAAVGLRDGPLRAQARRAHGLPRRPRHPRLRLPDPGTTSTSSPSSRWPGASSGPPSGRAPTSSCSPSRRPSAASSTSAGTTRSSASSRPSGPIAGGYLRRGPQGLPPARRPMEFRGFHVGQISRASSSSASPPSRCARSRRAARGRSPSSSRSSPRPSVFRSFASLGALSRDSSDPRVARALRRIDRKDGGARAPRGDRPPRRPLRRGAQGGGARPGPDRLEGGHGGARLQALGPLEPHPDRGGARVGRHRRRARGAAPRALPGGGLARAPGRLRRGPRRASGGDAASAP